MRSFPEMRIRVRQNLFPRERTRSLFQNQNKTKELFEHKKNVKSEHTFENLLTKKSCASLT